VAFLGTAIGLSLRKQYPLPYLILGIACLSALALASWVASVAWCTSKGIDSPLERVCLLALPFGVLAVIWHVFIRYFLVQML
jgi:hypothetical protein